jgi:hypothetical protein
MFTLETMDMFRTDPEEENINEEVKTAWYHFCLDYFKCVSLKWKHLLNDVDGTNTFPITKCITPSDEAILMWFIRCKYNLMSAQASKGFPKKGVSDRRKSGPHDSSSKLGLFVTYYNGVKEGRDNKEVNEYWDSLFWERFHKERDSKPSSKKSTSRNDTIDIPIDD